MKSLSFFVPGIAVPKARARVVQRRAYTPMRTKVWENLVNMNALEARFHDSSYGYTKTTRFHVDMAFALKDGRAMRCDIDNLVKSILDGMNGVAYKDDSQVTTLTARKFLAKDCRLGVSVCVRQEEDI